MSLNISFGDALLCTRSLYRYSVTMPQCLQVINTMYLDYLIPLFTEILLFSRKFLLFYLTPTIPGWWYISWSGGIGWVPANYLRPVDGAQPDMTPCDGG